MKKKEVIVSGAHTFNLEFDVVNVCPHCGKNIEPKVHYRFLHGNPLLDEISNCSYSLFHQCLSCYEFFSSVYSITMLEMTNILLGDLKRYTYRNLPSSNLPDEVEQISPNFVEIYKQAMVAESESLDQIAGVGYRKSLEFLIKDYLIRKSPDDAEQIKKEMLGKSIERIDNSTIKNLAKAATWIGNDETHYERRHTNKDIHDMKKFIRTTSLFISSEYIAEEATDFVSL